ncbi:MAG: DUF4190 domain-containing protein [Fastidiosipilaceae bacterium]|jgi:hypothetical protein|nr:DUF4190 domain-containing protein [Clostridiaceae bacterium]
MTMKNLNKSKPRPVDQSFSMNESNYNQKLNLAVRKTNVKGILGFIFSIISILVVVMGLFDPWFAILYTAIATIFSIVGLILSIVGKKNATKRPDLYSGKGLAVAGIVCGILAVVFVILQMICYSEFFNFFG